MPSPVLPAVSSPIPYLWTAPAGLPMPGGWLSPGRFPCDRYSCRPWPWVFMVRDCFHRGYPRPDFPRPFPTVATGQPGPHTWRPVADTTYCPAGRQWLLLVCSRHLTAKRREADGTCSVHGGKPLQINAGRKVADCYTCQRVIRCRERLWLSAVDAIDAKRDSYPVCFRLAFLEIPEKALKTTGYEI